MGAFARPLAQARRVLTISALLWCSGAGEASAEPSERRPEIGYNYGEIETPRTLAMGGANRALASSFEGLFVNPANMAASRIYHLGVLAQIWPEAARQSYGAAAVDSIVSSSRLAGGIGGTWNFQDKDGVNREFVDLRFALALPFSDRFFFGLGGRYLMLEQDGWYGLEPSAASGGLGDEKIVNGLGLDAGLTIKATDALAISLVGNNLNHPDHGFQPTSVGGGVGYGTQQLTIEADVLADFSTWEDTQVRAMAGLEYLAAGHYPLRLGYRYDQALDTHAVSAGIGWIDETFAAEVGVRRTIEEDATTIIGIGLKYHLESSGITPGAESF